MLYRMMTFTLLLSAWTAALPATEISIAGRILGPDGEPRPKTEVRLEPIPSTYARARLRLAGRPGPDPVDRTRAGVDGTFELTAPEAGMWKVVASAPGLLTMEYRLVPLVETAELPDVTLPRAGELEVRLRDAEGRPRPGAVGVATLDFQNGPWRPQLRLAIAGEDGVARLPRGEGEKLQLEALVDGHPLVAREVDTSSLTIEAPVGVTQTVRLLGRRQRPVAEAVAFQGNGLLLLALSDADGLLTLVVESKEPPDVRISTAEHWNGSFKLEPDASGGAEDSDGADDKVQDLSLDPPVVIHGRVLDLASRDPLAGALVWAFRGEETVTDEQGRYALELGVYKSKSVQAAASGYQSGHSQVEGFDGGEAPTIALAPSAALSGKVVDEEGGLLAGVAIELRVVPQGGNIPRSAYSLISDGWHGRTSSRGTFHVPGLPTGLPFRLTFTSDGFAPRNLAVEPLEALENRSGIKVVLTAGRLGVGRVVDQDDVPVAGAEIHLQAPPPSDDLLSSMRMMGAAEDELVEPASYTDAEGRFEIADLAVGTYDLEVRATGFAPAKIPGIQVTEGEGSLDFGTVGLIPGAALEGTIHDPGGRVIEGAEVTVSLERKPFMLATPPRPLGRTLSDARGRFVIADLLPGRPVGLIVTKKGYGSEVLSDLRPPTDEPLAVVLQPAGSLKGKVVDRDGEPVSAVVMAHLDFRATPSALTMRQAGGGPTHARTDSDGSFLIEDVEPGLLQVRVRAESYLEQVRTGIELKAGAELELDFVLDRGAVVEGTVVTADGEPVVQASIHIAERSDSAFAGNNISAGGETDAEGRYRVSGAPTGQATITVSQEHRQRLTKPLEIRPGTNTVDLVLERGFAVSGQVVSEDGLPVGGAAIAIHEATQPGFSNFFFGRAQAVTSADGTFTLEGVKAGKHVVTASLEGFAPASSEPLEVAGDVNGLFLELRHGATLEGRVLGLDLDELGALGLSAFGQEGGGMRRGRVDYSGEYAFDGLAPGKWVVQAQVAGSGRSAVLNVEIPEGVSVVEKDIELGTGFTLTGIVLDSGQGVVGVNVAGSSTTGTGMATTGSDGRFRIESLPAGSYQVMVMDSSGGMLHSEALELSGDHDLRIEISTGTVTGFVLDAADASPLAGAAINLERLDAGEGGLSDLQLHFGNRVESDSAGFFRLPRVRRGTWRVIAVKPGYAPGEAVVNAVGGGAQEVEIRMTATEGITFSVILESGVAVSMVNVATLDGAGRRLSSGPYSVTDGKVRVSTVPPGRWDLVVQGGDSAATRFTVTSPGDQGQLVLRTGGVLHIKVPELEQEPLSSVTLTGPDGKPFVSPHAMPFPPGQWIMSSGQAMVPALVPGVWSFTVTHKDGRSWSGSATVTPGGTTEVSLP